MSNQETILEEQDGLINYSIIKGVFYIADLQSKHLVYRVMKHIKYEKPIYEYCFKKVQAEIMLKELKAQGLGIYFNQKELKAQ